MKEGGEGQGQCNLALVRFLDEPLVHHFLGVLVRENYLSAYVFIILPLLGHERFDLVSRIGVLAAF